MLFNFTRYFTISNFLSPTQSRSSVSPTSHPFSTHPRNKIRPNQPESSLDSTIIEVHKSNFEMEEIYEEIKQHLTSLLNNPLTSLSSYNVTIKRPRKTPSYQKLQSSQCPRICPFFCLGSNNLLKSGPIPLIVSIKALSAAEHFRNPRSTTADSGPYTYFKRGVSGQSLRFYCITMLINFHNLSVLSQSTRQVLGEMNISLRLFVLLFREIN